MTDNDSGIEIKFKNNDSPLLQNKDPFFNDDEDSNHKGRRTLNFEQNNEDSQILNSSENPFNDSQNQHDEGIDAPNEDEFAEIQCEEITELEIRIKDAEQTLHYYTRQLNIHKEQEKEYKKLLEIPDNHLIEDCNNEAKEEDENNEDVNKMNMDQFYQHFKDKLSQVKSK